MYYRGAVAAIVVYDITDEESYDGAISWIQELKVRGDANAVIALVGEFEVKLSTDLVTLVNDNRKQNG